METDAVNCCTGRHKLTDIRRLLAITKAAKCVNGQRVLESGCWLFLVDFGNEIKTESDLLFAVFCGESLKVYLHKISSNFAMNSTFCD